MGVLRIKRIFCILFSCAVLTCWFPVISHAQIGTIHFYAGPGAWAMDYPDGLWWSQHHLRYLEVQDYRDCHGDKKDEMGGFLKGIDNIHALMYVLKLGHIKRFGKTKQFQWNSVGIFPVMQQEVRWAKFLRSQPGWGTRESDSGISDPYWFNSIGWRNKADNIHLSFSWTVRFPFGHYDKDNRVNVGNNRFEFFPAVYVHLRFPWDIGNVKSLWMIDFGQNFEWITENHDTDFDERDTCETDLMVTWYPSRKTRKIGFTFHPDFMIAVNDSQMVNPATGEQESLHDGDGWSFALGGGITYQLLPNLSIFLQYTQDVTGEEMRMDRAAQTIITWVF